MARRSVQAANKLLQKYAKANISEMQFELGIDQAGRGPVFGSMVYAALWWPIPLKQQLSSLGFMDSKVLSQEERNQLFIALTLLKDKLVFFQCEQLSAQKISTSMQSIICNVNLNVLSHNAALKLLKQALALNFNIRTVYVDTVGDPGKYRQYLQYNCSGSVVKEIIVQPKADRDHKVVSAASVCAKVNRDRILKEWVFPEGIEYEGELGSGYPGDPKTKRWLQANKHPAFGYPNLVRFSWATSMHALESTLLLKIKEEEEEFMLKGFNYFQQNKEMRKGLDGFIAQI